MARCAEGSAVELEACGNGESYFIRALGTAAKAGEAAVEGARPLAKNGYKVPLTKAVVKRTLLSLAAKA